MHKHKRLFKPARRLASTFALFCYLSHTVAQSFEWAQSFGIANHSEVGQSITSDSLGNVYSFGFFTGAVDFDPDPNSASVLVSNNTISSYPDAYVLKHDSAGNFLWAKHISTTGIDVPHTIICDNQYIYITGDYGGIADFDPDTSTVLMDTNAGAYDFFVAKWTLDGNLVWNRSFGSTLDQHSADLDVDQNGNVYITGHFKGVVDFDPHPVNTQWRTSTSNSFDSFILKLSSEGDFRFAYRFGVGNHDYGKAIAVDPNGYVVATGNFKGQVDFLPGSGSAWKDSWIHTNIYQVKFDTAGTFQWVRDIDSENNFLSAYDVAIDLSGNIYTTGIYDGLEDFDPSSSVFQLPNAAGFNGFFIQKLDSAGSLQYAKGIVTVESTPNELMLDLIGNVYLAGGFKGAVDFDPDTASQSYISAGGIPDPFILKLDKTGNYLWAYSLLASGYSNAWGASLGDSGQIYLTGQYQGTIDFDPQLGMQIGTSTFFGSDGFVLKLNQCPISYQQDSVEVCGAYVIGNDSITQSGVYYDTILTSAGCGSLHEITLTINEESTEVMNVTACDSILFGGSTIKQSGVYFDTLINLAGCDSIIELHLIIGNQEDSLSATACDTYLFGDSLITQPGNYTRVFNNQYGCDSTVFLDLHLSNTIARHDTSVCDSFVLDGMSYFQDTVLIDSFISVQGCDSIIERSFSVVHVNAAIGITDDTLFSAGDGLIFQWFTCDSMIVPITGATDSFLIIDTTQAGNYQIQVSTGLCTDTSTCYSFSPMLSFAPRIPKQGSIIIYPNPTSGFVTMSGLSSNAIYIVDMLGNVVMEVDSKNQHDLTLNLSGLASGSYFVKSGNAHCRLIKL